LSFVDVAAVFVTQSSIVNFQYPKFFAETGFAGVGRFGFFLLGGAKATVKSKPERCRCGVCGSPTLQPLLVTEV
jgi:hypothetical protein